MAYSKVLLLGEHAVVYGHLAVAGALDQGITAIATPRARSDGRATLTVPAWNARVTSSDKTPLARALRTLLLGANAHSVDIIADAHVPAGAGLGSSAALAVAISHALAPRWPIERIEHLANAAEAHLHDNPSGVDVALAARGGLGTFCRSKGFVPIDAPPLVIAIGLSGQQRSTADMVRYVATIAEPRRAALTALGSIANTGAAALARGDVDALGPLCHSAHSHLAALGVSTPTLDRMVDSAMTAGATGAKLTGAGGGGAVIALGSDAALAASVDAWRSAGYDAFICHVGAAPSSFVPTK